MTPRGLIKLTAVANNIEALRDWQEIVLEAERYEMFDYAVRTATGCELAPDRHMPQATHQSDGTRWL
jgi:hypothetical protein